MRTPARLLYSATAPCHAHLPLTAIDGVGVLPPWQISGVRLVAQKALHVAYHRSPPPLSNATGERSQVQQFKLRRSGLGLDLDNPCASYDFSHSSQLYPPPPPPPPDPDLLYFASGINIYRFFERELADSYSDFASYSGPAGVLVPG